MERIVINLVLCTTGMGLLGMPSELIKFGVISLVFFSAISYFVNMQANKCVVDIILQAELPTISAATNKTCGLFLSLTQSVFNLGMVTLLFSLMFQIITSSVLYMYNIINFTSQNIDFSNIPLNNNDYRQESVYFVYNIAFLVCVVFTYIGLYIKNIQQLQIVNLISVIVLLILIIYILFLNFFFKN